MMCTPSNNHALDSSCFLICMLYEGGGSYLQLCNYIIDLMTSLASCISFLIPKSKTKQKVSCSEYACLK